MRLLVFLAGLSCTLADHFYDKASLAGGYFNLKRPDPRCRRIGHYLPHPYDPCKYMVCDYGKEPWQPNHHHSVTLYTREMRCPSGLAASRKAFYQTKTGQPNPCIVLDDKCLVKPEPRFQIPLRLEKPGNDHHSEPHHSFSHRPYYRDGVYNDKAHEVDYRQILKHFGMAYLNHGRLSLPFARLRPVQQTYKYVPSSGKTKAQVASEEKYHGPLYRAPHYVPLHRDVSGHHSAQYIPDKTKDAEYKQTYDSQYVVEPSYRSKKHHHTKLHSDNKFLE